MKAIVIDGYGDITTEAPQWHHRGAGSQMGPIGPYLGTGAVTLQSPQKSTPFCDAQGSVIGIYPNAILFVRSPSAVPLCSTTLCHCT
jgi:hypothetical protein